MCTFSVNFAFDKATNGHTYICNTKCGKQLALVISKLDLCEGGSVWLAIFTSDIKLGVDHISCFIFVCPFAAVSKATVAENVHIVLSSPY